MNYHELNIRETKETILKILEVSSYTTNASKWSARFKDQKDRHPLERAVWWVEWLLRNPNCEYLKSPVLRLGFIAGNSYDIIVVLTLVSILMVIFSAIALYNCCIKSMKYSQKTRLMDLKKEK